MTRQQRRGRKIAMDKAELDPRVAAMHHDGRHAWLRLTPEKITSWDFRKIES
jgi:hypothetical protein